MKYRLINMFSEARYRLIHMFSKARYILIHMVNDARYILMHMFSEARYRLIHMFSEARTRGSTSMPLFRNSFISIHRKGVSQTTSILSIQIEQVTCSNLSFNFVSL